MHAILKAITLLLSLVAFSMTAEGIDQTSRPLWVTEKVMLIMGQDLESVREWQASSCCRMPAGITTYLGFYHIDDKRDHFRGLGLDNSGQPHLTLADWGAGGSNAYLAAQEYPHAALVIGLSIAEADEKGGVKNIAAGMHDAKISKLAQFFKVIDKPVYLRIGYEFDGAWNAGYEQVENYKAAWRRIVDGLTAEGVTNINYVWQAGTSPVDDVIEGGQREAIADWYPGDDYVDWIGSSLFNRLDQSRPVKDGLVIPTSRSLQQEVLEFARARKKPVMIAESAPQGYDLKNLTYRNVSPLWDGEAGQDVRQLTAEQLWAEWFEPTFNFIDKNKDVIKAFAYINANWDAQSMWGAPYAAGYWGDSRIQTTEALLKKWLAATGQPHFIHGSPTLFKQLKAGHK
ncbi:glycosyl hydrolase [Temperatibacter marinus]|uniref:Glycosyl hydrolase n=1 Tax=Temperatibacter marinus TaxID=1456591 RepID=A0AA52EJC9_9PROT|nr:glycosyl hydrolase [Temperatibacter marinus]WND03574.1 glycosyl hydrolase [Temperatibacter marinus]